MKKGDWVQFKSDWGKPAVLHDLGRITRVAKNGSWADVETRYGRKRIPNPHKYLRVIETETVTVYI
jgi:hypothetical protein